MVGVLLLWLLGSWLLLLCAAWVLSGRWHIRARMATLMVDRALKNLLEGSESQAAPRIKHTPQGVSVGDFLLAREQLSRLSGAGIELESLSISRLRLDIPTFRSRLRLEASGVRLEVRQQRLPEARHPEDVAAQHTLGALRDRWARLRVIEQLLWGRPPSRAQRGGPWLLGPLARATRGALARAQAATLRRAAALITGLVELHVSDVGVRYVQAGEPGPRPAVASHLEGFDGLEVRVRALRLLPQSPVDQELGTTDSTLRTDAQASSTTTFGHGAWYAACSSLRTLWTAASPRPASTSLAVTGVSVALHTWPSMWTRSRSGSGLAVGKPLAASLRLDRDEVERTLAHVTPETYVVLQQWEASVHLTVLPRQAHDSRWPSPDSSQSSGGAGHETKPSAEQSPFVSGPNGDDARSENSVTELALDLGCIQNENKSLRRVQSLGVLGAVGSSEALDVLGSVADEGEPETDIRRAETPDVDHPLFASSDQAAGYLNRGSLVPEPSTKVLDSERRAAGSMHKHAFGIPQPSPERVETNGLGKSESQHLPQPGGAKASPFEAAAWKGARGGDSTTKTATRPVDIREARNDDGAQQPSTSSSVMRATVDVQLKAFVPEFNAAGVALLSRVVERALYAQRYADYWEVRPLVPVAGHATAWWRHAGGFLAAECGALSRHKAPITDVGARRARRLEHAAMYAAVCSLRPLYEAPGSRWWSRPLASIARTFSSIQGTYGIEDDHYSGRRREGREEGSRDQKSASQKRVAYRAHAPGAQAYASPDRRSGEARSSTSSSRGAAARLADLEARLSLEEVAHFRLATAATHNRRLANDPELLQFVADKVDAIVLHRGTLNDGLQTLLLHEDQPSLSISDELDNQVSSAQRTTPHTIASQPPVDLTFRISCPKFGIAMEVGSAVTATSPVPGRSPPEFPYISLALRGISLCMDACGNATLRARDLACGESTTPAAQPEGKMVSCPSRVCRHTCKAAEFFRYATTGRVMSDSAGADEERGLVDCIHMVVSPRPGVGGAVVDAPRSSPGSTSWTPKDWVPGGSNVVLAVAAVGVTYREQVIGALLDFADACEVCKHGPWLWARRSAGEKRGSSHSSTAQGAAEQMPVGPENGATNLPDPEYASTSVCWMPLQAPEKRLPALPLRPPSLEAMVLAMRSVSGGAVSSPLRLPTLRLEVRCPGIAAQLPYVHLLYLRHVESVNIGLNANESLFSVDDDTVNSDTGSSSSRKPPLTYRLTLTAQNLRLVVSSEDLGSVLAGGCARRVEATAFVDFFSYLSRESRTVIARHLMPQRAGLDVLMRPVSDEGHQATIANMQERLREAEIVSMAKVWAYPEDMPAVLAGIKVQQQAAAAAEAVRAAEARERRSSTRRQQHHHGANMPYHDEDAAVGPQHVHPSFTKEGLPLARSSTGTRSRPLPIWQERPVESFEEVPGPDEEDAALPPGLLTGKSILDYPLPLVPFMKIGLLRASTLERLEAAPSAPTGAAVSAAGTVLGVQAWVSPLHLWHLLSVERTIRRMVFRFNASSLVSERRNRWEGHASSSSCGPDEVASSGDGSDKLAGQFGCGIPPSSSFTTAKPQSEDAPAHPQAVTSSQTTSAPFRRLVVSASIGQVNVLWMIGTWTSKDAGGREGVPRQAFRRHWGITVKRNDPAFIWAQWMAPIYSLAVADVRGALCLEDTREVMAGVSVDGIIVRDLQLPERAQHAYVLRPLPARARRTAQWVGAMRRRWLGIRMVPVARLRWFVAVQAMMLARQARLQPGQTACDLLNISPVYAMALGGLQLGPGFGPQVRFEFRRPRGERFSDEARVEVGQMLAYVRLKHQASIVVAAGQMAQIVASLSGRDRSGSVAEDIDKVTQVTAARDKKKKEITSTANSNLRHVSRGLRVTVDVVGIDLLFRVQSRDLLSLKMQAGRVVAEKRHTIEQLPSDVNLYLTASVQDIMMQDLRASAEHCMVLVPNGGAEYCSLDLAFTSHVDSTVAAPSLVLELQNPRLLLLFRFVSDIMNAIHIMVDAAKKTKAKAKRKAMEEGGEAVCVPPTAPQPPVPCHGDVVAAQAVAEAGPYLAAHPKKDEVKRVSFAETVGAATLAPVEAASKPSLQVILQLHNVGIILPTATNARSVLGAHMEQVLLSVPGDVMPSSALEGVDLPDLGSMVEESLLCNRTYRHSAFHDPSTGVSDADLGGKTSSFGLDVGLVPDAAVPTSEDKGKSSTGTGHSQQQASSSAADGEDVDESSLTFGDRIRRAAQEEAVGSLTTKKSGVWRVMARQRQRALRRAPGVLYLDDIDNDAERELAGVLRIKPDRPVGVEQRQRVSVEEDKKEFSQLSSAPPPAERITSPFVAQSGAPLVSSMKKKTIATHPRGSKSLPLTADVDDRLAPPASPAGRNARTDKNAAVSGMIDGDKPPSGSTNAHKFALPEEEQVLSAAELERAASLQVAAQTVGTTKLALSVESFHVVRGTLIKVPIQPFGAAEDEASQPKEKAKQGSFVPSSLVSFSWPSEVWDLVSGAPFLASCNVGLTMFERPTDKTSQLHISSTALTFTVNSPNYTALVDFTYGNLEDLLNPPDAPPEAPGPPPVIVFNPTQKFGPRPGQRSTFRLTVGVPRLAASFEAHPREWCSPGADVRPVTALDAPDLRPFLRMTVSNALLDFGKMEEGDKYLKTCATSLDIVDLRLAYRLEEIVALAAADGEEIMQTEAEAKPAGTSDVPSATARPLSPTRGHGEGMPWVASYPELRNPLGTAAATEPVPRGYMTVGSASRQDDRAPESPGRFQKPTNLESSEGRGSMLMEARDSMAYLEDDGAGSLLGGELSDVLPTPQDSEWETTPGPLTWGQRGTEEAHSVGSYGSGDTPSGRRRLSLSPEQSFGGFDTARGDHPILPAESPMDVFRRGGWVAGYTGQRAVGTQQLGSTAAKATALPQQTPVPATGIKMSVARRLSEQADRRRSFRAGTPLPSARGAIPRTPAALFAPAPGSGTGQAAATPGGATPGVVLTENSELPPVVDFVHVPELEARGLSPDGAAVVCLVSAPAPCPPEAGSGRRAGPSRTEPSGPSPGGNPRVKLEVCYAQLADHTQAVEVTLSDCLLCWPYFDDTSLFNSLKNLFTTVESHPSKTEAENITGGTALERELAKETSQVEEVARPIGQIPKQEHPVEPHPWTYVNTVLEDLSFFGPVFEVGKAQEVAAALWAGMTGEEDALDVEATAREASAILRSQALDLEQPSSSSVYGSSPAASRFHALGDLALVSILLASLDEGLEAGVLPLESRGLVLCAQAARGGYAWGGDGETNLHADLRAFQAFVRDPGARERELVLPFTGTFVCDQVTPQVAEQEEVERLHRAAEIIQRRWAEYRGRKRRNKTDATGSSTTTGGTAAPRRTSSDLYYDDQPGTGLPGRNVRHAVDDESVDEDDDEEFARSRKKKGRVGTQHGQANAAWKVVDDLIMDVATPRTRHLLQSYRRASAHHKELVYLQRMRSSTRTSVKVDLGAFTVRAAFSHVPFWRTAFDGICRVRSICVDDRVDDDASESVGGNAAHGDPSKLGVSQHHGGTSTGTGTGVTSSHPTPRHVRVVPPNRGDATPKATAVLPFRPRSVQVSGRMLSLTGVLCNDKPEAFGAPDVLLASLAEVELGFDMTLVLPDRPPNKAAQVSLHTSSAFLNSSTSRWEPIFEPWPLRLEGVDVVSPLYLSDRRTNLWISSDQHLDAAFNPASFMSIGDALAFYKEMTAPLDVLEDELRAPTTDAGTEGPSAMPGGGFLFLNNNNHTAARNHSASSGSGAGAIMSLAPQKYLIQNQSGLKVYYWADGTNGGARSPVFSLSNGSSESLRVTPAPKRLQFAHSAARGGGTGMERVGSTLHLHFEGNWMPLRDVAVNVVGKYRYRMKSPADNAAIPIIVDIILVGRTKVITLHSGIWVENNIDRLISLRLHIPTTPLVPPSSSEVGSSGNKYGPTSTSNNPLGAYGSAPAPGTNGADVTVGPLAPGSGCYLPLTAVLGGLLFLNPDGFCEATRDVIRLSADLGIVLAQQGYISCDPDPAGTEEFSLHVALQTTPARLVSEFQAFKHMECTGPGLIQRASTPLEVTLSVKPPLLLKNALPYEMRVLVWQVYSPAVHLSRAQFSPRTAAASAAREEPGRSMPWTSDSRNDLSTPEVSGSSSILELPITREHEISISHAAATPGDTGLPSKSKVATETFSPRLGLGLPQGLNRGRYFCYAIPAGASQGVYVDFRQTVLLHLSVEEIGMRSTKWALCSWIQRGGRPETESQTLHRLPREIPLRMVDMDVALPVTPTEDVGRYLVRLKEAALDLSVLRTRIARETRMAFNRHELERAFLRVMRDVKKTLHQAGHPRATLRAKRRERERRKAMRSGAGTSGGRSSLDKSTHKSEKRRKGMLIPSIPDIFARRNGSEPSTPSEAGTLSGKRRYYDAENQVEFAGPSLLWRASGVTVESLEETGPSWVNSFAVNRNAGLEEQDEARPSHSSQQGSIPANLYTSGTRRRGGQPLPAISEGLEPLPSPPTSPAPLVSPFEQPADREVGLRQRFGREGGATRDDASSSIEKKGDGSSAGPELVEEAQTPKPLPQGPAVGIPASPWAGTTADAPPRERAAKQSGIAKRARRLFKKISWRRSKKEQAENGTQHSTAHNQQPTPEKALLPSSVGDSGAISASPSPVHVSRYTPAAGAEGEPSVIIRTQAATAKGGSNVGTHGVVELELANGRPTPSSSAEEGQQKHAQVSEPAVHHRREASLAGDMLASSSSTSLRKKDQGGIPWWRRLPSVGTSGSSADTFSRERLKRFFDHWRVSAVSSTVERVSPTISTTVNTAAMQNNTTQLRAPPLLLLGVHNSLVEAEAAGLPASGPCSMTLYVPYWLNNRTGVDLFTRDRASAPARSLLFGMALPWDHGEVFVPGTSMTAGLDVVDALQEDGLGLDALNVTVGASSVNLGKSGSSVDLAMTAGSTGGSSADEDDQFPTMPAALLEFKLVLMNRQENLRFGLAHVARRGYSPSIPVKTVGNKGTVELRGPADAGVIPRGPPEEGPNPAPVSQPPSRGSGPRPRTSAGIIARQVASGAASGVTGAVSLPVHLARQVVSGRPASVTSVEGSHRGKPQADGAAAETFDPDAMAGRESSRADWGYAPGEISGDVQRQGMLRHLRRSSMSDQQLIGVLPTSPGTRLVRVVQQTPVGGGAATPPGGSSPRAIRTPPGGGSPRGGASSPRTGSPQAARAGASPEPSGEMTMQRGGSGGFGSGALTALVSGARKAARRLSEPPMGRLPEEEEAGTRDMWSDEEPAYELPRRASAAVTSAALARGTAAITHAVGRRVQHARTRSASIVEDVVPSLVRRSGNVAIQGTEAPSLEEEEDAGPLSSPGSADETAQVLDSMRRAGLGGLLPEQQQQALGTSQRRRTVSSLSDSALRGDDGGADGSSAEEPPSAAGMSSESRAGSFLWRTTRRVTAPAAVGGDVPEYQHPRSHDEQPHAHRDGSTAHPPQLASGMSGPTLSGVMRAAAAAGNEAGAEEVRQLQELEHHRRSLLAVSSGVRLYEFAVDVAAGPPESIYRHTKLVTLKPKYIIENQTGMPVRVKQLGTRDPPEWPVGANTRASFAHVLEAGARSAVYWDDVDKPRELVIQPLTAEGRESEWGWSGGFPIPETEWYFGLRIRSTRPRSSRRYLNIPANVTVGGSGCVQVTLKALTSLPPYRIENQCKDVDLVFIQLPLVFRAASRSYIDRLAPGQVMPYAWDEPMLLNKLRVQARVVGRGSESRTADYAPDQLGDAPVLLLPTHGAGHAERLSAAEGKLSRSISAEVPDAVRQKLVSLLAAEFSKKVYVTVFADGPTRVLRFSDERNISSLEQYHVILDLTARLKQVETQLREVSTSFARLNGMAGSNALDLYGRSAGNVAPSRSQDLSTVHRPSKRLPSSGMQAAAMRMAQTQRGQSFSAGPRQHGMVRSSSAEVVAAPQKPQRTGSDHAELEIDGSIENQQHGEEIQAIPEHDVVGHADSGERPYYHHHHHQASRTVHFDDDSTTTAAREERLRPYRQLVIQTGSPGGGSPPGVLAVDVSSASAAVPSMADRPPIPRASASLPSLGRISSSRDWGHIGAGTPPFGSPSGTGRVRPSAAADDAKRAALARSPSSTNLKQPGGVPLPFQPSHDAAMGSQAPPTVRARSDRAVDFAQHASQQSSARRQDLLRGLSGPDARLLIGGDLTVTVVSAEGLYGVPRSTHAFARIHIRQPLGSNAGWEGASSSSIALASGPRVMKGFKKTPLPSPLINEVGSRAYRRSTRRASDFGSAMTSVMVPGEEEMSGQTNVVWQSTDPVWEESLLFRDVCAVSELEVEIFDLGGSRNSEQLEKLAHSPQEVIKSCRFLGCAEISLSETLDAPSGVSLWFPLMRRRASDHVSGELQLRFAWEVTARGLLSIKLNALERVLRQRAEILAALRPVPASISETWAPREEEDEKKKNKSRQVKAEGGDIIDHPTVIGGTTSVAPEQHASKATAASSATSVSSFVPGGFYGPGDEWIVQPSSVTAQVLLKHAHDVARRTLVIGVMEARGLEPRRGVVMALAASELPSPAVELSVHSAVASMAARSETTIVAHTLTPRWDTERHTFPRLDPADTVLTIRLWDCHGGLRHSKILLGEATVAAGHAKGEEPIYVWVGLRPPKLKAAHAPMLAQGAAELQVCLRLQWQREVVRGMSVKVEASLAGAGLLVMGSLQDELFNLTLDDVHATAVQSHRELEFKGSVRKAQLDNQILDAVQPVVLAPAAKYGTRAEHARSALIQLEFVRSFAGATGAEGLELVLDSPHSGDQAADEELFTSRRFSGPVFHDEMSTGADRQSIKSFKRVQLTIGDLDLLTDEAFLEAVQSFFSSIPTADIWQDRAWQEQQRRLLAAQFGPREVESLAINASIPSPLEDEGDATDAALDWVVAKETGDLAVLHGQSDLSSWYFVEYAEISRVLINVTVSLTSRLLTGERALATRSVQSADAFHRSLSASGFQLVNVGNVPILFGKWVVGSDPSLRGGRFSNGFLSQRALQSNLLRHYRREALKEAHKVLSGAGPAIASVPLTVIWASGSAFALLRAIGRGTTGPGAVVQQFVYVPLMSISMIVSGFSRMLAATLAGIPPGRVNGDSATVQRIIQRPTSALEAFFRVGHEMALGVSGGISGLVLDPLAGWQLRGWSGLGLGVVKASIGVLGRPTVGVLEGVSQLFGAFARMALGREGILGKLQRRVRAPGAAFNEDPLDALQDERATTEARIALRTLIAAWQRVLPQFFPGMSEDRVVDVINIRATRVLLVTDRHLAYLRARHLRAHSIYRAKWLVPLNEVQNLTGSAETMKIQLTSVHRYDLWILGVWPVAARRRMRCGSRMVYEQTVSKLSRLLQASKAGKNPASLGWEDSAAELQARTADLTILSAPYVAPERARSGTRRLLFNLSRAEDRQQTAGGGNKPTITEIT